MEETTTVIETTGPTVGQQFAKLILSASAGFIAGKLVENVFDTILERRRNTTA